MFPRTLPANATLTDRFGWLLYWLFEGMALDWRRRGVRPVHEAEITQRILGLWKRLRSVLARWEAGTLRGREHAPRPPSSPAGEGTSRRACAWSVLPRRFGWLRTLLLPPAQGHVNAFQALLDGPEMQAIIAAAPQVGRVLRPFCHFLGIATPVALVLPRRKRGSSPRPSPRGEGEGSSPRPSPRGGEGEGRRRRTAREVARAAIERSERTGKPVDPRRIGAVAYGYVLHWPRDGNCPPPEIGYGGRSFTPLPKDYVRPKDEE